MGYLVGIPILMVLVMLQSALVSHLTLLDGRADLVLLAVIGWGLAGRTQESLVWGLVGGLLLDLLSGGPFGVSAISLVGVAYLLSLLGGRLWEANFLMPLAAALVGSALLHGLAIGGLLLSGRSLDLELALTRVVLPSTFLNLLLILPAAQLMDSLRQSLFPERMTI